MEHVLFLVFVLIQSQVSAKVYQQSTSECRFKNNIYKSSKVRSDIHCSALCNRELCSRFIYDSSNNMCDLHLDGIMPSNLVKTPLGTRLFLSTHKDCNAPGYDFVESHNLCIKWYGGNYTWSEARKLCQQDGGDLLTLDKLDKWNFIFQHLGTCSGTRTWLGLHNQTWINGVPFQDIYNVTTSVDDPNTDESCVRLKLKASGHIVKDNVCTNLHMVLCEIRLY